MNTYEVSKVCANCELTQMYTDKFIILSFYISSDIGLFIKLAAVLFGLAVFSSIQQQLVVATDDADNDTTSLQGGNNNVTESAEECILPGNQGKSIELLSQTERDCLADIASEGYDTPEDKRIEDCFLEFHGDIEAIDECIGPL